jgi:hypothetical protein
MKAQRVPNLCRRIAAMLQPGCAPSDLKYETDT